MALQDETPIRKKKKSALSPISEKLGLDVSTELFKPPAPQPSVTEPGLLGGSPEANLNQTQNQTVLGKVTDKRTKRKTGLPNDRA